MVSYPEECLDYWEHRFLESVFISYKNQDKGVNLIVLF